MKTLHVALLVVLQIVLQMFCGLVSSEQTQDLAEQKLAYSNRHNYKLSLNKPMIFDLEVPHFHVNGDVILTDDYIRLTPGVQSKKGSVWSKDPVPYKDWQAVIKFSVTGRGRLGGDGFAFWYTSKPLGLGDAMGAEVQFDGLMVYFDTYDNDNNRQNPYIGAILNDGKSAFNPDKDGSDTMFAGCTASFRNAAVHVVARVTYFREVLTVEIDTNGQGASFRTCFRNEGIVLPMGYHIGLTAATGALADDHDIHGFDFYQLDPPQKGNQPAHQPTPEDAAVKENFERIQEQVQILRAKHDTPGVDSNYEAFIGKIANMDQLISELALLSNSQMEIKASLDNVLHALQELATKVGGAPPPQIPGSHYARPGSGSDNSALLMQKLTEIQNELRQKIGSTANAHGSNPNEAVFNSVSRIETSLRQVGDRLSKMESQQTSNLQEIQALRRELALSGPNAQHSRSSSSSQKAQDSEDSNTWIIVIVVLLILALAGAGVFFMTRKSNPKKFI